MTPSPPVSFSPELTSERLEAVAQWLLEELYATEEDLIRATDSGYTRGCTAFGRQKKRIMTEALSGRYKWLALSNSANDIVFTIGGVPCRFSNDDPSNPSKHAVLTANRFQLEFLDFAPLGEPGRFCFIIDRGHAEVAEPRVEFLGFTPGGEIACRWVSNAVRVLSVHGRTALPQPVEVGKPQVVPKKQKAMDSASEAVR